MTIENLKSIDRSADSNPNVVVLRTTKGDIKIILFENEAPKTVTQFKKAIQDKFYEGCSFYRFEPNFVLQGGCFTELKDHLPELPLEYKIPNRKGTVAMARTSDPNSATSEFFIQLKDNSAWLGPGGADKFGYTVFGEVLDGWNTIKSIMDSGISDGSKTVIESTFRPAVFVIS